MSKPIGMAPSGRKALPATACRALPAGPDYNLRYPPVSFLRRSLTALASVAIVGLAAAMALGRAPEQSRPGPQGIVRLFLEDEQIRDDFEPSAEPDGPGSGGPPGPAGRPFAPRDSGANAAITHGTTVPDDAMDTLPPFPQAMADLSNLSLAPPPLQGGEALPPGCPGGHGSAAWGSGSGGGGRGGGRGKGHGDRSSAPSLLEYASVSVQDMNVERQVLPRYPEPARIAGLTGDVVMSIVINAQGQPIQMEVLSADNPLMAAEVLRVLPEWRFKPVFKDGKPVWANFLLTFRFILNRP